MTGDAASEAGQATGSAGNGTATIKRGGRLVNSRVTPGADYLEHFARRIIADAVNEASAAYWRRRAAAFERAMARPGDFTGLCSVEQIEANNAKLAETAAACRAHAQVVEMFGQELFSPEITAVLDELQDEAG